MLNKNTKIIVKNRSAGSVGYSIPDMNNLKRKFQPNERKEITFEELQKLSYLAGGMVLLSDYLQIENEEAVAAILGGVELEYNYSPADIKDLLINGSLDALLDCLDFAPSGVIDLVKQIAVDIKLNDFNKRDAILKSTGFDITKAIEIKKELSEQATSPDTSSGRRVAATAETQATEAAPVRRTVVKK